MCLVFVSYVYARTGQGADSSSELKGIKIRRRLSCAAVAPEQLGVEEYAHLRDHLPEPSSAFPPLRFPTDEMRFSLPSVLGLPIGKLAPVKITGLSRLSSIKLERGCAVSHGVGPVQDDKSVVILVSVPDETCKILPHRRFYVRRVDEREMCKSLSLQANLPSSGTSLEQAVKLKGLESAVAGVFLHAYCPRYIPSNMELFGAFISD